jgi:hypothetical protein
MPRVARTVIPRIRKSLRERGWAASIRRSFLLPIHLLREYRAARSLRPGRDLSEFDRISGVDTEGDFHGWTYLSDLDIPSPNWIEGNDYSAIEPERFNGVLASFDLTFEGYTFVDFGSGKGRALLLASEFPFRRIVGLEFSPELHQIAEKNIRLYRSSTQKCRNVQSINIDFVGFVLPVEPLVLFFFDPCRLRVLAEVLERISKTLLANPRSLYVAYIAPGAEQERLLTSADFLKEMLHNTERNFRIYRNAR